jgi:hypothetical protein
MRNSETRAFIVGQLEQSGEMEGLPISRATSSDADSYVTGRIDSKEFVDRVRARYGLA